MGGRLPVVLLLSFLSAPPAPAEEGPPPLPLAEVLERVRASAPSAIALRERAAAAYASARQARRFPNPTAEVRTENWPLGSSDGFSASSDVDLFATLSQPLPVFGTHGAAARSAEASARAAGAEAKSSTRTLLADAARLYLATLRARDLAAALAEVRDGLSEVVRVLEARVAEGWSAEGDLLKLRAEKGRASDALARAEIELDADSAALGALLGEERPVEARRLFLPAFPELPEGDPEEVARKAAATRPEVVAASERLAAAREAVRLEKSRRIPEPSLTAGYKRTGGEDTAVLGLAFPLPVLDLNAGAVARAESEARAAEADLALAQRRASLEGAARLRAARRLLERALAADEELVRPAEGARRAARAAFREGGGDVLKLVDAERVRTEAVALALQTKGDAWVAAHEARTAVLQEDVP